MQFTHLVKNKAHENPHLKLSSLTL